MTPTTPEPEFDQLLARLQFDRAPIDALVAMGAPAVAPLIGVLERGQMDAPRHAAEALGRIRDAGAVEPLITRLQRLPSYSGDTTRDVAATALGSIGDVRAVAPLIAVLRGCSDTGADAGLRRATLNALGQINDIRAVEVFVAALNDSRYAVRLAAVNNLGRLGGAQATQSLVDSLSDREIAEEAAKWLGELRHADAIAPLMAFLRNKPHDITVEWLLRRRQVAIEVLARIGEPAIKTLTEALGDHEERDVRQAAADVLEKIGWEPTMNETGARYSVIKEQWERCVEIGAPAIEPVAACLNEAKSTKMAARTLLRLGDFRGIAALRAILAIETTISKEDIDALRMCAVKRREPSVALLHEALSRCPDVEVKKNCAAALVRVEDSAVKPFIPSIILDWLAFAFRGDISNDEDIQVLAASIGVDPASLVDGTEAMSQFSYETTFAGSSSSGNWSSYRLKSYTAGMPAIVRLCNRNNLWTSCILFRVANRKDAKARLQDGGHWVFQAVSLAKEREVARRELSRRGVDVDPVELLPEGVNL